MTMAMTGKNRYNAYPLLCGNLKNETDTETKKTAYLLFPEVS